MYLVRVPVKEPITGTRAVRLLHQRGNVAPTISKAGGYDGRRGKAYLGG